MTSSVPPEALMGNVHQLLRDLKSPDKLMDSQWASSCLATQCSQEHLAILPRQVLPTVLGEALQTLETEASLYADILRGRYWEGLSVAQMVTSSRPQPLSERRFFEYQNEAVQRFAQILWEKEQRCKQEQRVEDAQPTRTVYGSLVQVVVNSRQRGLFYLVLTAVIVTLARLIIQRAEFPTSLKTPSFPQGSSTIASAPVAAGTPSGPALVCGETMRITAPEAPRLLRSQGVSSFTVENTEGNVLSNWVRMIAIDPRGAWIGYFSDKSASNGLGQFNKQDWADCNSPAGTAGMNINDVAIDQKGRVWVAAEKIGVAMFDGTAWRRFTTSNGLPSADTFGLTIDAKGNVWVGTWEGVAKYDGQEWTAPYALQNNTIFDNYVHAIAFDSIGNIWIGHIKAGMSQYRVSDGSWIHHTATDGPLGGDQVRAILVRPERGQHAEQVWVATSDGGVSVYEKGDWRVYRADDGLPSNDTRDLAIDRYDRMWVASSGGVAFFDDQSWHIYHTLDAYSVAIGPDCQECPYDADQVLTGTRHNGLTHSRIPLDTDGIKIMNVTYPKVVTPGQRFVPEVVVAPITPYKLLEERGDMLINTDEDDSLLFGAYEHIAVKGVIDARKAYIFSAPDTPMIAPQLPDGVNEQSFTSTWRVWMHTRYVGPPIHITFTVRKPG
ncbi:MAG: two-component regulator propeller domain-containing protein [Nitrospira sp.]